MVNEWTECRVCWKRFSAPMVTLYITTYGKCRGKQCPDCGKIRKLGTVELKSFLKLDGLERLDSCTRCKKLVDCKYNSLCPKCFFTDFSEEMGCVCIFHSGDAQISIYCSLCGEVHSWVKRCKDCINKSLVPVGKHFFRLWEVILPAAVSGAFIGAILVLFLGILLKKKREVK